MDIEKNMCDRLWLVWVITIEEILGLIDVGQLEQNWNSGKIKDMT